MNQTAVIVVGVIVAVAAVILAIHQLGEAKDRWVNRLAERARMRGFVRWSRISRAKNMSAIFIVAIVGAVVGASAFAGVFLAVRDQVEHKQADAPLKENQLAGNEPVVFMTARPITAAFVPPLGRVLYSLEFRQDNVPVGMSQSVLGGGQTFPYNFRTPTSAYYCEFTNYSHEPLFNLAVAFRADYLEMVATPFGARSGARVSFSERLVHIPVLAPDGGSFVFYIINRSSFTVQVLLPDFASTATATRVKLERPRDGAPSIVLVPNELPTAPPSK
jgi:hypothetical protein